MTSFTAPAMALLALVPACLGGAQASAAAGEEEFVFKTWSGQQLEAFKGSFMVPENRAAPGSRAIPIKYVRLAATGANPGPPIVYLAGGPGGSGIQAINYRYRMFMAMRRHADVIALDQRGSGESSIVPQCRSEQTVPATRAITDRQFAEQQREALRECLAYWRRAGVDLGGYNTVQSAQDLEALRRHLKVQKLILWGTSYGSHLALAALKAMPDGIDRVVVSSVEGLNQTYKLPARAEQYFERLQAAIDTQPAAHAAYPDVKELIRRVHARLEHEPLRIRLQAHDGSQTDCLLQRRDVQMLAASLIADPSSAALLLGIYRALDRGLAPALEAIAPRLLPDHLSAPGKPITLEAMPLAMDLASGMTPERRQSVLEQARTALLGAYLDPALLLDGMAPELDLGDAFRAGPASAIPVLALSGTLDGRTLLESQREALAQLRNATLITVENGGHNLFDEPAAAIQQTIDRFLAGGTVRDATLRIELPDLAPKTP